MMGNDTATIDTITASLSTQTSPIDIPLRISGATARQPVTFGVPLPPGTPPPTAARLQFPNGRTTPAQTTPLCHWPNGSLRWLQIDAVLPATDAEECRLELGEDVESRESRVESRDFAGEVILTDAKGRRHAPEFTDWQIETAGPVRTTVVREGRFRRVRGLRCELRVSRFAGTGLLRVDVTLHNPRRAKHRGGLWDLGDAGSVLFRDFSVEVEPKAEGRSSGVLTLNSQLSTLNSLTLYQDSSGGENWDSRNHVNREGRVPCRLRGYRLTVDGRESSGLRAEPVVRVGDVSLAMPEFWQQFPKALEFRDGRLRAGLFPREFDDLHELQGGERKTHTLWLCFGEGDLAWVHSPAVVRPDVKWCDQTGALPRLEFPESEAVTRFDEYLEDSLTVLMANRERVDEYGWRNYGEIFADHEQTYYTGDEPLISHYNNQFDMVHGFLLHFLRTGDRRWYALGDALARHVRDIDLYHTREDKAAYNGGLFWFTDHYLHAHTCTHRTYSRHNRPESGDYGGGPGAQHNFTSGLLLHYCLTGDAHSRDAVLQLADWVIAMDDGRRTVFGVVDDGATGLATGSAAYQGPDRAGGNSINALLDAWQLSGRREYLEYAERLIRRCVHPEDDVAALDLLDVESRWSYTVLLTSVAKYLDVKAESGRRKAEGGGQRSEVGSRKSEVGYSDSQLSTLNSQLFDHSPLTTHHSPDEMAAYTKCSLLRYAEWMLVDERPYFDQVEKLEFPTEAWAAQEFRKANVLRLAARHAGEPLRTSLLKRGEELADRAWQDLLGFETRTYARAMAIVMIEGLKDCGFRAFGVGPATDVNGYHRFPAKQPFVPQRARIRDGLRRLGGIAGLAAKGVNPQRWLRYRSFRQETSPGRTTSGG